MDWRPETAIGYGEKFIGSQSEDNDKFKPTEREIFKSGGSGTILYWGTLFSFGIGGLVVFLAYNAYPVPATNPMLALITHILFKLNLLDSAFTPLCKLKFLNLKAAVRLWINTSRDLTAFLGELHENNLKIFKLAIFKGVVS